MRIPEHRKNQTSLRPPPRLGGPVSPPASTGGLLFLASIFALFGSLLMGYVATQKLIEMQVVVVLDSMALKAMPTFDFRYRNVRASIWERAIRINGISIQQLGEKETVRIDRISVSGVDWDTIARLAQTAGLPTLPRTIRFSMDGLHLTPRMLGAKGAEMIADLGYEEIVLSMSSGFVFDRANKIFAVDRMTIEAADMGRLSYSLAIGEFPFPTDRELLAMARSPKDQKPTPPSAENLTFRSGEVRYDDFSLLGRIDQKLKRDGKPSLAQSAQMASRLPAAEGGFVADAQVKALRFLSRANQTLRLSARPAEPIPFSGMGLEVLMGPDKFAKTLNLRLDVE